MVEVIHSPSSVTGQQAHSLDFMTKSEDDTGRMVEIIHSLFSGTEHKDSRDPGKCPVGSYRCLRSIHGHTELIRPWFVRHWSYVIIEEEPYDHRE
jgi:hypothetical protein